MRILSRNEPVTLGLSIYTRQLWFYFPSQNCLGRVGSLVGSDSLKSWDTARRPWGVSLAFSERIKEILLCIDSPVNPHRFIPKKALRVLTGSCWGNWVRKNTEPRWRQLPGQNSWPTPASSLTLEFFISEMRRHSSFSEWLFIKYFVCAVWFFLQNELGTVSLECNHSAQESEAGGLLLVWDQTGLYCEFQPTWVTKWALVLNKHVAPESPFKVR